MSEDEATSFDTYSVQNAITVETELGDGCEAYKDVFTFKRWRAQGYSVRRGEHGIRIPRVVHVEDRETGEIKRMLKTAVVFCRHQVVRI